MNATEKWNEIKQGDWKNEKKEMSMSEIINNYKVQHLSLEMVIKKNPNNEDVIYPCNR